MISLMGGVSCDVGGGGSWEYEVGHYYEFATQIPEKS